MTYFNVTIRPVCITCSTEMTCSKNGAYVKLKKSHAYVAGDVYTCTNCKVSFVTGFARKAIACDENLGIIVAEIDL
jgi:DNA-directed RNA polymerase subunit RPC12/RpoP